jgi:hypothetical protein
MRGVVGCVPVRQRGAKNSPQVEDRPGVGDDDHESNRCPVAQAISARTLVSATGSLSNGCVAASASGVTITPFRKPERARGRAA